MNYPTDNAPRGTTASAAGEKQDAWAGDWKIAAVSDGLDELYVNGSPPQFRLERKAGAAPVVYALKPLTPVELPACLAPSVLLTQHGRVQPGPVKCQKPLAAPFVEPHKPYWD